MKTLILLLLICGVSIYSKSQTYEVLTDTNFIVFDYNPDVVLFELSDSLKIDVNHDGVEDIKYYFVWSSFKWAKIKSLNINCKYAYISINDSLQSPNINWIYNPGTLLLGSDNTERFGVRLLINGQYYYGWIHIVYAGDGTGMDNATLTIKKYAFCKIPNYPLLWGQTELTGVKAPEYSNEAQATISIIGKNVSVSSTKQIKEIALNNLTGAQVMHKSKVNTTNTQLSTNGISAGIYIISLTFADGETYSKQIMLE